MGLTLCFHENCSRESRIWFPKNNHKASDIALHPWCILCGQIKNISDDNGKTIGYWTNILSRICNHYNITKVQRRLIANEIINNEEFKDIYGITITSQKNFFINLIQKHAKLSYQDIDKFLY